jgi:hypothetical protein
VLLVVLGGGGGGGDDGLAGSEGSGPTTEASSEDQGASGAADTTVRAGQPQGAQPTDEVGVSPTEVTISPAETLVHELQAAYNERDWDTVRRLAFPDVTDEDLERTYGNVEIAKSFVLDEQQTGDNTWDLTGALVALDRPEGDRGETTNVVCVRWRVDTGAGMAPFEAVQGTDGKTDRRLDGWLPEDQFESAAQRYCG